MSYTDGIGNLQQAAASSIPAARPAEQASDAADAKRTDMAGPLAADHADLSNAAGIISKALEHTDVRMDKVQALRQAIASGSYHVSSSDVANKLIKSLMD